ncbi:beta-lactamase class A [Tenacibaculum adriaticum]|uniref:beta-lactamase n=1 Tax=Tenacibaculum adriaticum TaxID=413713 RepID=A0A5S5DN88_9FLAO|nr:serine hydrolase [Tenacibaculum adriaticum]TYP97413.1 beta-lactamase class A [Tenacibaculum adriaticum]
MKKNFIISIFILVVVQANIYAQTFPIKLKNGETPLRDLINLPLQAKLESTINSNHKWKALVKQKRIAIGVVDLSNIDQIKFADINGNEMMYAASLPKIAVLLAAMDAIEKGELKETSEVKADMKLMISKSNNQATTRMIDRLGYEKIETVLTSDRYSLYDENYGGGLWVGKRYASGNSKTNREPLKNLSHAATVSQVCRFYYLLLQGKLVNEKRSKEMLDIMEKPALHHKFVNTLERIAPHARLFRKSGSWRTYHSDSILVWGKGSRKYILVALIEDANGEQIIRSLVEPIEKVLKEEAIKV